MWSACAANCAPCCVETRAPTSQRPSGLRGVGRWRKLRRSFLQLQRDNDMNRVATFALTACVLAAPVYAALKPGAQAPDFTTQATLAGKPFTFSLADALKHGPVVLYFYPAAFTPGCTVEAHEFAEATDKFKAMGATVIGVSHDPIDTLNKFSVSECRNKFAVASDADQSITKSYDAVLAAKPEYANRTSYVIAPSGKIIYEYTAMNPDKHVENTMAAVEKYQAEQKKGS